jgi:hypothetical protein
MKSWFEARAASRRRPADFIARGNEARDARLWADAAEFFSDDPLKDLMGQRVIFLDTHRTESRFSGLLQAKW